MAIESLSAGSAHISVRPSLRGFHTQIRADIKSTFPNGLTIQVTPKFEPGTMNAQALAAARGAGQTVKFKAELDRKSLSDSLIGVAALSRAMRTLAVPGGLVAATPYVLSLASSLVQAAGAAALLPAALTAGGVAAGTFAVGLSGVGDTFKELAKADESAATTGAAAGKARKAALESVRSAQEALEDSQRSADRSAVQGAEQVADARRAVGDAVDSAARQVKAAQDELTRSEERARQSREALTRAYKEGREELQQLQFSVEGAGIAEEAAADRLDEARKQLNEARTRGAGADEIKDLDRAVRQADLDLRMAADRYSDLKAEGAEWARTGISGSQGVVAAQRQVDEANQAVRESREALTRAETEGDRAVADARGDLGRTIVAVGQQQDDATRAVERAELALRQARDAAGEAGVASASKASSAMAKLSPAARDLVTQVRALGPAWAGMRLDVQDRLLTGIGTRVNTLGRTYIPVLNSALGVTADGYNRAARETLDWLTTASATDDVEHGLNNVALGIDNSSDALKPLAEAFTDFVVVGSEFLPDMGTGVRDLAVDFRDFIAEARKTGQLKAWIQDGLDVLKQLGRISGNVFGIIGSAMDAADEAGHSFLTTLESLTERIDTGLKTPEGAAGLREFFGGTRDLVAGLQERVISLWPALQAGAGTFSELLIAGAPLADAMIDLVVLGLVPLLHTVEALSPVLGPAAVGLLAISAATKAVSVTSAAAGGTVGLVSGAINGLAPSNVASRLGFVQRGMDAAALSAGVLTERLTKNADAGTKVATGGSKIGTVLTRVGSSLPLVGVALVGLGLAYEHSQGKAEAWTDAINRGGAAAIQAVREIQAADADVEAHSTGNWIGALREKIGLAAPSLQDMRANLDGVGRAQLDAAIAANRHQAAVDQFGADSPQAAAAAAQLAAATDGVERAQSAAKHATESHTDQIVRQRDEMHASLDADLRFQESKLRTQDAQEALTTATDQYGVESREAERARLDLSRAQLESIRAAGEATRATFENRDSTAANESAIRAQNLELLRLVASQNGPARQAALDYIGRLDRTQLELLNSTTKTAGFSFEVRNVPGGKTVVFPVDHEGNEVTDLHHRIDLVPKNPRVTVSTQGVVDALGQMAANVRGSGYTGGIIGKTIMRGQFAGGGVLPGYTPGRDVHRFHTADGRASLDLSGGEAIMRPEWTKTVGSGYVTAANKAARSGGVAGVQDFLTHTGEGRTRNRTAFAAGGIYRLALPGIVGKLLPFPVDAFQISYDDIVARTAEAVAKMASRGVGIGAYGAGAPFYVREIARAGRDSGVGRAGNTIGVATAIVESGLRMYANRRVPGSLGYPHDAIGSDHDSVGLFQQRQAGWGTLAQRMNPYGSAKLFFNKLNTFNWRAMNPGAAAQRVQVSAYPGRYATRMGEATRLLDVHAGGGFDSGGYLMPGIGVYANGTGVPELALPPMETRAYDTLTRLMKSGQLSTSPKDGRVDSSGTVNHITVYAERADPESVAAAVDRHLAFTSR